MLKLNPEVVRNWIDAGKLPAIHVGRRVRVKRSDFDPAGGGGLQPREASTPTDSPTIWDGEVPMPEFS